MMHSTLRMRPKALLPLSNQRHSRHIHHNRRRSGSLCRLYILHSPYSLRSLWRLRNLRSHGNHRIPARASRR
jgi:hypothetical protein